MDKPTLNRIAKYVKALIATGQDREAAAVFRAICFSVEDWDFEQAEFKIKCGITNQLDFL